MRPSPEMSEGILSLTDNLSDLFIY
jgi:hypothetical protein